MTKATRLLLALFMFSGSLMAQSPEKMSYQSVIRDASENLVANSTVGIQISILQGTSTGTAVYVETQTPMTNANGLASMEIGMGTPVTGTFAAIDWSAGPYFIKTETDPAGGTSYTLSGTSELLSVPYALYAASAAETDPIYSAWDKSTGISITESQISDLDHFTSADETDPIYSAWDKSTGISITESQISDLDHFTSADETDPVFGASTAAGITGTDITNWNNKLDTEVDPQVASATTNSIPVWDGTSLVDGSITDVGGDVGIGTTSPDPSAQLDVSSTTKGFLPPRMTQAERDAIATPAAGLIVWCTNCGDNGEVQVYNGTTWTNIIGGAASVYTPAPGDTYQGGIVAYIFQSGDPGYVVDETHGIIVHPNDISSNTQWGPNVFVPGTATGIGTGQSNTATVIAAQGAAAPYAAQACDNFTDGVYSDWFLPSRDELFEVYQNVHRFGCGADAPFNYTVCPSKLGNFNNATDANYWSSSCFTNPDPNEYGWRLNFNSNYQAVLNQTWTPVHVLATRYF